MFFITKSLIQHCERSELRLHFEWTKVDLKCQKNRQLWGVFENLKLATVLPNRSVLIEEKLVENSKIPKIQIGHFE